MPPSKKAAKKGKASEEARWQVELEGPPLWGAHSTPLPGQDWIDKASIITNLVWQPKKTAKDPINTGMTTHQSQELLSGSLSLSGSAACRTCPGPAGQCASEQPPCSKCP
eukprot:300180-Rhodomonas_salina.2